MFLLSKAPGKPLIWAALSLLACALPGDPAGSAFAQKLITLPLEVFGPDGSTSTAIVNIPAGQSAKICSLWLQVHGLEYDAMTSVQVNQHDWFPLTNKSVSIAEPGRSYGGIGGGYATLRLTLPLPRGIVQEGTNAIRFRFNRTNGISSGFRVLAFNFKDEAGLDVLPAGGFVQDDPNAWKPPLNDAAGIAAGAKLWHAATLKANSFSNAPEIRAHCGDCHTSDGRDLKYFNYSNASIIARARFHGLSPEEGDEIASYIRSLSVRNPGRPWDPPYQPGPGLDAQPAGNWAAGAGLSWVLNGDGETLRFLFPGQITASAFRPDGNLNPREIPIAMQLPDWNHWLPQVHPLDAWGAGFSASRFAHLYYADGQTTVRFEEWGKAQHRFLRRQIAHAQNRWSPALTQKVYSSQLWQLVKTWEITQTLGLEEYGRTWANSIPSAVAPAANNIPDGPNGMGGDAVVNEYFTSAWYELQLLVNNRNHRHRDALPIDWPYFIDSFLKLYQASANPEPARLLIALIKAMQSADPKTGPEDVLRGWRPERNLDPRIMVSEERAPMFRPLGPLQTRIITESILAAWLDKNTQYRGDEYFQRGVSARSFARFYDLPKELRGVSGGEAWDAVTEFQAQGVRPELVKRLVAWGNEYTALAQLFHY